MKKRGVRKIILAIAAVVVIGGGVVVFLAGSKTQQAARLYTSAQELVARGDNPRAMIELRNALQKDPALRDARVLFAELLLKAGRRGDAFGQYRQLYLQNPEDIAAAREMALIAFEGMSWDEARQYSKVVLEKQADDPQMQAVAAGLDYRDAVAAKDTAAMQAAAAIEARLLAADPGLLAARRVLVASHIRMGDLEGALALADEGLAQSPDDRDLNNARFILLDRLGHADEMEQQLLSMVALYPKDEQLGQTLVRFYVSKGRLDEAEKILRGQIDPNSDKPEARMVLLRFLAEVRSPEVMRDELGKVMAMDPLPKDVAADPILFRMLKAQADYVAGDHDKAMSELEAEIKGAEASAEIDRVKVQLARMRADTGNTVGARALVEEVLGHDASQTEAMKLKSGWLIDDDQTEAAIAMLRDALADAPNDAQVLTLMARAYQREGQPELMADMLARAVEASNQAPQESLYYARWLFQQGQYVSTETVLVDALRRQPKNLDLLVALARTHLAMKDWGRSEQDINTIGDRFDTEQSRNQVNELRAQLLVAQGRNDDLSQFLDQLSRNTGDALATKMAMIRTAVVSRHLDQALSEAQNLAQENPGVPDVVLLVVQLKLAQGQADAATADLLALTGSHPDYLPGWLNLQAAQIRAGQLDAAQTTIDAALKQFPDSRPLQLSKAFVLEKKGDIEGAISIYDGLYAANSNDQVVANNLASLLASTRDDQASLDRAWTVARRLNGSQVAAFQDTYGWLAFRRGDAAVALPVLEKAAKGLPQDPSVAYHLGRVYAAQKRGDAAKAEYARAEELLSKGEIGYPALAQDLVKAQAELK